MNWLQTDMHMSISMEACLFSVCIFTQTDMNLTHASFTGKQSTENTVAKCFLSVKNLETVEAYVLDSIRSREKQLMGGEAQWIKHHFGVTAMDMDKVEQYLSDPSNEARLNALQKWLISSGMDYKYNKIKAILLLSFLSS